jgi:hypothetical protein
VNRSYLTAIAIAAALALTGTGHGFAAASWEPSSAPARVDVSPRVSVGDTGTWQALGTGVDGIVWSLALTPTGELIAGGNFTQAGGSAALGVARWNGTSSWSQVGDGLDDTVGSSSRVVSYVSTVGDRVYAAGNFTRSGAGPADDTGLAVFDGASWSGIAGGVQPLASGAVLSALIDGDDIYVAGEFVQAGPPPADDSGIALWNGSGWSNLGGGFPRSGDYPRVLALLSNGDLVAAGSFLQAGPGTADDTNIAVWDGSAWSPLDGGLGTSGNQVYALVVGSDDSIYAGGNFATADNGAVSAKGIARWDGASWQVIGNGTGIGSGAVRSVVLDEDRQLIYLGGTFTTIDGVTVNRVTVRDEGTGEWVRLIDSSTVGVSGGTGIEALAIRGPYVYAGGNFTSAGPVNSINRVARWTWSAPSGSNVLSSSPGQSIAVTGTGFIGVPASGGVYIGGVASPSYIRDDSTSISSVVIPSGVYGTVPIEVNAVGGRAVVGSVSLPGAPAPPSLASAPRDVVAVAGDASARVSWAAPTTSGSFPISTYQAVSSPGGRSCLIAEPALSCEVSGLTNGTTYTFTVRALTGAGWSASSEPSNAVTPEAAPRPSVVITGSREGKRIGVTGQTTGFGMGGILRPWTRFPGQSSYSEGAATILVSMDGTFDWGRRTGKKVSVYVQTPDGSLSSNAVTIPAR